MIEYDHDHAAQLVAYGRCIACSRAAAAPAGVDARPPVARGDDPWSAKLAAARIEPTRGTKKAAVLGLLLHAAPGWVDGSTITSPTVGGSEGLRRLRELREADGWPIERRPHPTSSTAWQYRLDLSPDGGQPVQEGFDL